MLCYCFNRFSFLNIKFIFSAFCYLFFVSCANKDELPNPTTPKPDFLDKTFGTNGFVNDACYAFQDASFQSDGKIILLGSNELRRYSSSGELDLSFGYGGSVSFGNCFANSMGILPNGKILVGGSTTYNDTDFLFIRFNQNGTLDTTFGINGVLYQLPLCTTCHCSLSAILVQNDGKFKVSVIKQNLTFSYQPFPYANFYHGPLSVVVYRYNEDGTIDNSHSFFEKTLADDLIFYSSQPNPNPNFSANVKDLFKSELIPDINLNKTIVTLSNPDPDYVSFSKSVFRIANDGSSQDLTLSNTQFELDHIKNINRASYRLPFLILNNGDYLLSSRTALISPYNSLSVDINNQGLLNNAFGTNGYFIPNFGNYNVEVGDIAQQSSGKLILVGVIYSRESSSTSTAFPKLFCFRLNTNGEIDNTFGESGLITIELLGQSYVENIKVLVDENDKIYISAFANQYNVYYGHSIMYKLNTSN